MLIEFLDRLKKSLAAEEKMGYDNSAVIGGLNEFVQAETDRALRDITLGKIPESAGFRVGRIQLLWQCYRAADLEQRQEILSKTKTLIDELGRMDADITDNSSNGIPKSDYPQRWTTARRVTLTPAQEQTMDLGISTFDTSTTGTQSQSPDAATPVANPRPETRSSSGHCSLDTDLMYLKGIGPKRAEYLAKMGLHTVYDLLYHFPARYEDRRIVKPISQVEIGAKESICATVLYPPQTREMGGRMRGRKLTKVRVGDASGRADLQWWNQPFREKQFQPGMQLFIYGKITEFGGLLQIETPEFEILSEEDNLQVGRIVPVYPMTEGLFQTNLRKAIAGAVERCVDALPDAMPEHIREHFGLAELSWSLRQIHFPDDWESKERARERLLFEELFLLQVALAQKKVAAHIEEVGIRHIVEDEKIKEFLAGLPFKLTGAQKRVLNEIRKDLKSPRPMNRLLHGDVGSGKTIVAAYALWSAHVSGHQGALLAPTEILAEQHFSVLQRLLKPHGIEVALLEGSLKSKNKKKILADIAEGRSTVVVGTHAIIQEGVEFQKLGVCVVDEQHRFGVMQRAALQKKGQDNLRPDVLVMTATPIPRTMALTVYGDLDVSVLDELPPGRQPIKTTHMRPAQREKAYQFVLNEVKKGRQAYVVCPLVEESEKLAQLKAATALAERLRAEELHDVRVGLLHGQMNVIERDEEMELFRAGMRDVLVSTTVIEVGVDVPNATIMLVEDAERFGLSQLHQLRGRVGRGEHASTCILLGDPKTDEGRARLRVLTKTQNGFEIAESDLQLRGPGEFYGTRQSGLPDFRLANIIRDVDTIALAREAAIELVKSDPHLELPEHQVLRDALRRFWGEKVSLVQVS
jgi:ATP-dependent DNA helicase RecG